MKEIEIKAKLRDKEEIMKKLQSLGCTFEDPIIQDDIVYARKVGSIEDFKSNNIFLRIRVKNNSKIFFTLKKNMSNVFDSIEHETEISSKEEMEHALLLMGYKKAVRVIKTRISTTYKGDEIDIDEVEGLGSFMEMERLTEDGDAEKIQEELFNFFISLGIDPQDRMTRKYDMLVMAKDLDQLGSL